ncbi:MAG: hypothetical protein KJ703_08255, partial [Alphaproteobacteria bacterium]|nr:hypothetical protein [Alphaproteobacteria bacterium]
MSRRSRSRPVLPFRRRRKGPRWGNALLVAAPLAAFALVFAWDGPPAGLAAALGAPAGVAAGVGRRRTRFTRRGSASITC